MGGQARRLRLGERSLGKGVDDLYTPEITNVNGFDATASVVCTHPNGQDTCVHFAGCCFHSEGAGDRP